MIDIADLTRQLTVNAQAMRALVHSISTEQAQWKPGPDAWCMHQVLEHLYNEERLDFRAHLKEISSEPPQPWGAIGWAWLATSGAQQALEAFLDERESSIAWLTALESADWDATTSASFGPAGDVLVLSAGDLLVSWVAHDFLHLRQMNELLYAWNEKQAAPRSVQYAGGW
jgi:hypothetical protein